MGQADAILIRSKQKVFLIDTGEDATVIKALARQHVGHIDGIVITHLHQDHIGGLDEIISNIMVDAVYFANGVEAHLSDETRDMLTHIWQKAPSTLCQNQSLGCGDFTMRVVWPACQVFGNTNADSVCLYMQSKKNKYFDALLCGDAEMHELENILETYHFKNIDFLKVGHHGSQKAFNKAQIQLLYPLYACISAGKNNRYGHPKEQCTKLLTYYAKHWLCTKDAGDVTLIVYGQKLRCITATKKS